MKKESEKTTKIDSQGTKDSIDKIEIIEKIEIIDNTENPSSVDKIEIIESNVQTEESKEKDMNKVLILSNLKERKSLPKKRRKILKLVSKKLKSRSYKDKHLQFQITVTRLKLFQMVLK